MTEYCNSEAPIAASNNNIRVEFDVKLKSRVVYVHGGLYDIGFDEPECHVIRKDGKMYYAFYADNFSGIVELRGLDNRPHIVFDYAHEKEIARLEAGKNKISIKFEKFALFEVSVYLK
jgi:alpha-galactosidase